MSERVRLAKEMVESGLKPSEVLTLVIELLGKTSAHQLFDIINNTLSVEEWPALVKRMTTPRNRSKDGERQLDLGRFFDQYERMLLQGGVDPNELAKQESELQITDAEWNEYQTAKEREVKEQP